MSMEQGPEENLLPLLHFNKVAQSLPNLKSIMGEYIEQGYLDQREVFEDDEERIDLVGEELTRWFVNPDATDTQIAVMQRCLRFGLRLSLELSMRTPGYMAGLDRLEDIIDHQDGYRDIVTSRSRYLSKQPLVREIVLAHLNPLTSRANINNQEIPLNVISFVLEEADTSTLQQGSKLAMINELRIILGYTPEF